ICVDCSNSMPQMAPLRTRTLALREIGVNRCDRPLRQCDRIAASSSTIVDWPPPYLGKEIDNRSLPDQLATCEGAEVVHRQRDDDPREPRVARRVDGRGLGVDADDLTIAREHRREDVGLVADPPD